MTANQIAYAKLREDSRHNRESEKAGHLTAQASWSQARTAASRAAEEGRHNLETERVNWWNVQEGARHNRAQESTNAFMAESQARFNSTQAQTLMRNALVNERNADLRYHELAESIRHNSWYEAEQGRHNLALEELEKRRQDETKRSNLAQEDIGRSNISLGYANVGLGYSRLSEETRTNKARESLSRSQLAEDVRAAKAAEANAATRNAEVERSNRANELIKRTQNRETERANRRNEDTARLNANARVFDTASSIARNFVMLGGLF